MSPAETSDPLLLYPRMMQPHRVNRTALRYLLSPRWEPHLRALLREAPIAAQSMFYWKPPGARGQALHQDNFYLKAYPDTCLAAWLAVDPATARTVAYSWFQAVMPWTSSARREADPTISFTKEFVPVPEGLQPVPVDLDAGDVLSSAVTSSTVRSQTAAVIASAAPSSATTSARRRKRLPAVTSPSIASTPPPSRWPRRPAAAPADPPQLRAASRGERPSAPA